MSEKQPLTVKFNWNFRKRKLNDVNTRLSETEGRTHGTGRPNTYTKRIKESRPDQYEKLKAKDRKRWHERKVSAQHMTSDEKESKRKLWREQKRKQREIKRDKQQPKAKYVSMTVEQKREYMRLKKREERARHSRQKKLIENKKSKDRMREKYHSNKDLVFDANASASLSRASVYRKAHQIKDNLNYSPKTYCNVVEILYKGASPAKKAEFEKRQEKVAKRILDENDEILQSPVIASLKAAVAETKKTRKIYYALAHVVQKSALTYRKAVAIGINKKVFVKVKRGVQVKQKIGSRNLPISTTEKVRKYWYSVAREYPCKKRVKKNRSLHIIESSYTQVFKTFKLANPNIPIGFVKFLQLKPANVRKLKPLERSVCCCNKCENAKWLLKAINSSCTRNDLAESRIETEHDLSDLFYCPYDHTSQPKPKCVSGLCEKCGVKKVRAHYALIKEKAGNEELNYNSWKIVREEKSVRDGQGGKKKKIVSSTKLVTTKTTVSSLVDIIVDTTEKLAPHIFRAKWQLKEFATAKQHMAPKSAIMVIDFAQNYACSFQDESQSSHWSQTQVTLHPAVAYVNLADQEGPYTFIENMAFISPDLKHDAQAVKVFTDKAHDHLFKKYGISTILQFSDCCASQYRGKTSFHNIAKTDSIKLERHYFEASHGKSAADGFSAVLKYSATKAVTNRQYIIRNAAEFFQYCQDHLKESDGGPFPSQQQNGHSCREFFFCETINRTATPEVKPVKGTMAIHAVRNTDTKDLMKRNLSCFCKPCRDGKGICANHDYVKPWSAMRLDSNNKDDAGDSKEVPEDSCDQYEVSINTF